MADKTMDAQEYEAPKLEVIGSVTELTLREGSLGDELVDD